LNQHVYDFVKATGALYILTGRPESQRADTVAQLESLGVTYRRLIMNDGSTADSPAYKKAMMETLLETFNVVAAVENDEGTLRRFRDLGVTAYAPGDVPDSTAETNSVGKIGVYRVKDSAMAKIETRLFVNDFEVRETSDGMTLTGYAARFNEPSEPLPFVERIAPGAFKRSLRAKNDIKLLWNHDSSMVLGSTRAGTLTLSEDEQGLRVEAVLPDTSAGRDAKVLIQRGDVTGFSFGFTVPPNGDTWNADGTERTLKSVRLLEVSTGVAFPAYPTTNGTAQVRSLEEIAMAAEVDLEMVTVALEKIVAGEPITEVEKEMVETVMEQLVPAEDMPAEVAPSDVPADPAMEDNGADMLALKRKKLALLELLETL
jgi:HK97 family phage prohead protease